MSNEVSSAEGECIDLGGRQQSKMSAYVTISHILLRVMLQYNHLAKGLYQRSVYPCKTVEKGRRTGCGRDSIIAHRPVIIQPVSIDNLRRYDTGINHRISDVPELSSKKIFRRKSHTGCGAMCYADLYLMLCLYTVKHRSIRNQTASTFAIVNDQADLKVRALLV